MKNHLSLRLSNMVVFCKPKTITFEALKRLLIYWKNRSLAAKNSDT